MTDNTIIPDSFKARAFAWANRFDTVFYFDSNAYNADQLSNYDCIIAVCSSDAPCLQLNCAENNTQKNDLFEQLFAFHEQHRAWLFGFLGYDLKNANENLQSHNEDMLHLPDLYFILPDIVITLNNNNKPTIWHNPNKKPTINPDEILAQIIKTEPLEPCDKQYAIDLMPRFLQQTYIDKVSSLLQHIQRGDLYEVNFCQEFYAHLPQAPAFNKQQIAALFEHLNQIAQAPMSAYIKLPDNKYVLCASPERFMQKKGNRVWSQPIKGTIKRSNTPHEDAQLKQALYENPKERAENVMIVDLVRNDLSRSAVYGTVKVAELFGVYTFKTVHHLISTITAEIAPPNTFADVLRHAFPMGSMTGAPKVRAMQLIETHETRKRGLFSGAIGYIDPIGDFDFNVVIRSLLHNNNNGYWSLQTGGAITASAIPEQEYQESLLKAAIIRKMLNQ